jgi:hypothetical protein
MSECSEKKKKRPHRSNKTSLNNEETNNSDDTLNDNFENKCFWIEPTINDGFPVRYFRDDSVQYLSKILLSCYMLQYASKVVSKLQLSDSAFIVNIIYGKQKNVLNMTGDTQLFLTGTIERNETPQTALYNEIREETSLDARNSDITKLERTNSSNVKVNWFLCSLAGMEIFNFEKMRPSTVLEKGKKKQKVVAIIFGNEAQIVHIFNRIHVLPTEYTEEGIAGLAAIRLADIKHILKIIEKNKYDRFTHIYWNNQHEWEYAFRGRMLT